MSEVDPLLDRDAVLGALADMATILHGGGVQAEIHVFGGTAMLLTFDARRVTRDIDAVWMPDTPVLEAARIVARARGWPPSWLNARGSAYLSPLAAGDGLVTSWPGLSVYAATPEHLLAMKVAAGRSTDAEDILTLARHLGLFTAEEIVAVYARHFPAAALPARKRMLVEDLAVDLGGSVDEPASPAPPSALATPAPAKRPRCELRLPRGGTCGRPRDHRGQHRR